MHSLQYIFLPGGLYMADSAESGVMYINMDEGKKRVMNNVKLYIKLLTKFKDGTNLDKLFTALESQNYEQAQSEAHTVKGVAANLALTELFKQSLEVETQIKGQSVKPESLESLKTCFSETLAEIEKVITQNG
jgi:HPt (histidine-containing phosphotransfer) domain-containing protein